MVLLASEFDKSKYLKAGDLEGDKKFRIKNVTEEMIGVGADKEKKLVVWFTNDEHGLVLNRVNNRTIRGAFGDAVDGWKSKIIVVFPTMVDFRGKMTPALRVRIPSPKHDGKATAPAAPKPPPDPELEPDPVKSIAEDLDDEIPF
jgi:hypothetical protein